MLERCLQFRLFDGAAFRELFELHHGELRLFLDQGQVEEDFPE